MPRGNRREFREICLYFCLNCSTVRVAAEKLEPGQVTRYLHCGTCTGLEEHGAVCIDVAFRRFVAP